MMMSGGKEGVLVEIRFVDIHGTYYYDIVYAHTEDRQSRSARIGAEDIYQNPQAGDPIRVNYTMNVVTSIERVG